AGTWLREGWKNGDTGSTAGNNPQFGFSDGVNPVAPGGTTVYSEKTPVPPGGPNPPGGAATGLGEAGGHMPVASASYGDNLGTTLTLNDRITFTGVFEVNTANQDAIIGFYNS